MLTLDFCCVHVAVRPGEKPEELKTDADRERAGEWYWCPDAVEGFVPAKKLSDNAQKWQFELENGQQVSINKKEFPQLDRLYWTQLRFLQKDLVMLDVMSHPLMSETHTHQRCLRSRAHAARTNFHSASHTSPLFLAASLSLAPLVLDFLASTIFVSASRRTKSTPTSARS